MTDMEDHQTEDDTLDFTAYHKAQVAAGERCTLCGTVLHPGRGCPTKCFDCKSLDTSGTVSHVTFVRCPACKGRMDMHNDMYEYWDDGDHEISCHHCDHEFEITTDVSRTFESPPLEEGQTEDAQSEDAP
jgi:hypothetical protein